MSFILDALRKSESERQREITPSLTHAPVATVRRETPRWVWFVIALLALALLASGTAWWRNVADNGPPLADRAPEAAAPGAIEPAPATGPITDAAPRMRPIAELADMEPAFGNLQLDLLAYNSGDPARGSAWINGRRYFPGDRIGNGLEVVEVRVDSVLLAYRGDRFLLSIR